MSAPPSSGQIMNCSHDLRYQSLFFSGRAFVFPCDIDGNVELDALSARGLENYLYARAMVGREFAFPSVIPNAHH
jgi:hypothetical protein